MSVAAVKIEVRWRPLDTIGAWQYKTVSPGEGSVDLPNLERGVEYQIEARSVALSGAASAWVGQTHVVSSTAAAPFAPTINPGVSLADGVHLSWTVTDTQRTDVEYQVQRTPDLSGAPDPAGWADLVIIRALAYTDGVTDGVTRWYRVRAVTYLGVASAWSSDVSSRGKVVADGATVGAILGPGGNVSGAVDANLRPLIDFTQPAHIGKNVDNMGDGISFLREVARSHVLAIDNPDFENSAILSPLPDGWIFDGSSSGFTLSFDTTAPYAGTRSLRMVNTSGAQRAVSSRKQFPVTPGETYKISIAGKRNSGTGGLQAGLWCLDKTGAFLAALSVFPGTTGAWSLVSAVVTIPANAVSAKFLMVCNNGNDCEYDAVFATRVVLLGDETADSGTRFAVSAVDAAKRALIDFSQAAHLNKILDNIGDGSVYGRAPLNLFDVDGRVPATTGKNLVYNAELSIHTPPTGSISTFASAVRVDDLANDGVTQEQMPNGWTRNFESAGNGEGVSYRSNVSSFQPGPGQWCMVMQDRHGSVNDQFADVCDAFPVNPGQKYRVQGTFSPGVGASDPHLAWYFRVFFYKAGATDFSRFSASLCANSPTIKQGSNLFSSAASAGIADLVVRRNSTGLVIVAATVTPPSDASFARIAVYHWNDGTATTAVWNLLYGNIRWDPVLDASSSELDKKGSMPITMNSGLSWTSSSTSIQWGNGSFALTGFRTDADLTALSIPVNQNVTGLSSATSYNHYPFLDENTNGFNMVTTGGTGSPAWAHVGHSQAWTAEQGRQDHVPLSLQPVTAATTSSGTAPGSDPGSGTCPRHDMKIEHREWGMISAGTLADRWQERKVHFIRWRNEWVRAQCAVREPRSRWIEIAFDCGESFVGTPGHAWSLMNGEIRQSHAMTLEDAVPWQKGGTYPRMIRVIEEQADAVRISVDSPEQLYNIGAEAPVLETHNGNVLPC